MFIRIVVSNASIIPTVYTISGKYIEFLHEIDFIRINSLSGRTVSTSKACDLFLADPRSRKDVNKNVPTSFESTKCHGWLLRRDYSTVRQRATRFTVEITRSEVALCEQQRG